MPLSVDMRPHLQTFASTFLSNTAVRALNITAAGKIRPAAADKGFYSRVTDSGTSLDGGRSLLWADFSVKGCHSGRCFSYNEEKEAADGAVKWISANLTGMNGLITFEGNCDPVMGVRFLTIKANMAAEAEDLKKPLLSAACAYARSVMDVFITNSFFIADGRSRFSIGAFRPQSEGIAFTLKQMNPADRTTAFAPSRIAGLMNEGLSSLTIAPCTDYVLADLGPYGKMFEITESAGK